MIYALRTTALPATPPVVRPGPAMPSISSPTRRRPLFGVGTAWSVRRRAGDPRPRSRAAADSGVSPIAAGASRGFALFVGR